MEGFRAIGWGFARSMTLAEGHRKCDLRTTLPGFEGGPLYCPDTEAGSVACGLLRPFVGGLGSYEQEE